MKVVVTGGGGFIGSHLVKNQLEKGREVVAVDINTQILDEIKDTPNLKTYDGDIRDISLMKKALDGAEWVFIWLALIYQLHLQSRTIIILM